MGTPRQPGGRARVKNALGGDSGGIGRAWNRVPRRVRAFLPLISSSSWQWSTRPWWTASVGSP